MTTKHTPQWEVWSDPVENSKTILKKFLVLTIDRQEFVAECRTPEEAKLIAAAPELLEACKALMPMADNDGPLVTVYRKEFAALEAAIARAESGVA
jgi:hypothetical protein